MPVSEAEARGAGWGGGARAMGPALLLTALVAYLLFRRPVFEPGWSAVLLLLILLLTLVERGWGYLAAVTVAAAAVFQISPILLPFYFLLTLPTRGWVVPRLGSAVSIAAAPLLLAFHLAALPPLLIGRLHGARAGLLAGGLTLLWCQVTGALSGVGPELTALLATPPELALLDARVAVAGAIGALRGAAWLLVPAAAGWLPAAQLILWATAGFLVGRVSRLEWEGEPPRYQDAPALAAGALSIWLSIYLLPALFGRVAFDLFLLESQPAAGLALAALVAAGVGWLEDRLPLPAPEPERGEWPLGREGPKRPAGPALVARRERVRASDDDLNRLELE